MNHASRKRCGPMAVLLLPGSRTASASSWGMVFAQERSCAGNGEMSPERACYEASIDDCGAETCEPLESTTLTLLKAESMVTQYGRLPFASVFMA